LLVFVQLVMAARTTEPWEISYWLDLYSKVTVFFLSVSGMPNPLNPRGRDIHLKWEFELASDKSFHYFRFQCKCVYLIEILFHSREWHVIVRTFGTCNTWGNRTEIEFQHFTILGISWRWSVVSKQILHHTLTKNRIQFQVISNS
jgi:hypothetical protein